MVPALEVARIEDLRARLATLVRKDKNRPLRRDNFKGRKISRENGRLQAIADDFNGPEQRKWLKISNELGEDVCAALTALFGDTEARYEVREPATLFSVGSSHWGVVDRQKGGYSSRGFQHGHRDYPWKAVQAQVAKKAYRAFGCLVALEGGTRLRVYPGSHLETEDNIDPSAFVDVDIPQGSILVFFDTLLHAGCGYLLSNLRHHMHLNADARNAIAPPFDEFSFASSKFAPPDGVRAEG